MKKWHLQSNPALTSTFSLWEEENFIHLTLPIFSKPLFAHVFTHT